VTGDGLAAGLLLCASLQGRKPSEVAGVMSRFPQVKENVYVEARELTPAIVAEVERLNADWGPKGRVLVRPSGTEPVIRVLAEAQEEGVAAEACGRIAELVRRELG
jgi:phosphoglucosamine mutase